MSWPRIRAELIGLIVAAGCASGPAPPPAAAPVTPAPEEQAVIDATAIDGLADLLRMEDERAVDAERIRALAADPNRVLRGRAYLAIGRARDAALRPLLLGGLADSSALVRTQAIFALGLLRDSSEAALTAMRAILLDSAALDARPGIEAAAALGRIGTGAAVDALIDRVAVDSAAGPRRLDGAGAEALLHLWRAPRTPRVVAAVEPYLRADQDEVRWNAAYALSRPGGSLAVGPLLPLAADSSHDVRALAVRALRAPAVDSAGFRESALVVLRTAVTDVHPHVRINAIGALATFGDTADVAAIGARIADEDGNVRVAALQALGEMGEPRAASLVADVVRDAGLREGIRAAALSALVRIDPAAGAAAAIEWAASPDWLMRMHATRALATLRERTAAEAELLARARDPDPRVAAIALRAIGDSTQAPAVHGLLIERLASADAAVRAAAVAGLSRSPHGADLALLMESYERARHDSVPAAALAVIDALAALERSGSPAARSFFLRFPPSDDARVRRRVAERFGDAGWNDVEPDAPGRPAAFYRDAVTTLMVPALTGESRPLIAIGTDYGEIVIALAPEHAPLTVLNFLSLIRSGYYQGDDYGGNPGLRWHRVVPNFVLQDGDPRGDGSGNPGYAIRDELNRLRYARGVVGMALSGPDTGGGQYFITHSPQPHLDAGYTIFGRVVAGLDVADRIVQDDPIHYIREIR